MPTINKFTAIAALEVHPLATDIRDGWGFTPELARRIDNIDVTADSRVRLRCGYAGVVSLAFGLDRLTPDQIRALILYWADLCPWLRLSERAAVTVGLIPRPRRQDVSARYSLEAVS